MVFAQDFDKDILSQYCSAIVEAHPEQVHGLALPSSYRRWTVRISTLCSNLLSTPYQRLKSFIYLCHLTTCYFAQMVHLPSHKMTASDAPAPLARFVPNPDSLQQVVSSLSIIFIACDCTFFLYLSIDIVYAMFLPSTLVATSRNPLCS